MLLIGYADTLRFDKSSILPTWVLEPHMLNIHVLTFSLRYTTLAAIRSGL